MLVCPSGFIARVLGVADEVDQNLHDLVLVSGHHRAGLVVANYIYLMPRQRTGIDADGVLDQIQH